VEPDRDIDAGAAGGVTATAEEFLTHRPMLYGLSYRLLGSAHDAQDVLQDAYLRWTGTDRSTVEEPRRYLTRVVARLAIDHLRARQARRESYVGEWLPEPVATDPSPFGMVADASDLSVAVLHLMERMTPPERGVYVLRTAFDLPYDEIARILDRTPAHCRQLYRRAAQSLGAQRRRFTVARDEHQRLLTSFLAAARDGDLARLENLLHADVVAWSDGGGRARAARRPIIGRSKVVRFSAGIHSRAAFVITTPVELNGLPAVIIQQPKGTYVVALGVKGGMITDIYVMANPEKLTYAMPS
jgi:RNA polymerase sigma-70 factor (ECF subfamily)